MTQEREILLNVLALHALTGLPIVMNEGEIIGGRKSSLIMIQAGETLIDPCHEGGWVTPAGSESSALTYIERSRAVILFTGAGGKVFDIEKRAQGLRAHPEMGAWIVRHDATALRDAALCGDAEKAKTLIESGAYPHAYDFQVIYSAIQRADAALVDWMLRCHPAHGEILDRRIHHGLHCAIDGIQNFGKKEKAAHVRYERDLVALFAVLAHHDRMPRINALMALNAMQADSPDVVVALIRNSALERLEEEERRLVERAFLGAASVRSSDRHLEVLIEAGFDVDGFPRAQSLRDRMRMEEDLRCAEPSSQPKIKRSNI